MTALEEVKGKLQVTWPDDDARINEMIKAAKADIGYTCGGTRYRFNFTSAGLAKTLMLEHVFYNWNNALHEFTANYAAELLQLSEMAALEMARKADRS